jgi:signal transduction histidine kinase
MSEPASRSWRRWWPRGIRTRLTLIYTSLFLAGGALLLGLTFGLVAHSLSSAGSVKPQAQPSQALIKECKQEATAQHGATDKSGGPKAAHVPSVNEKCKLAFLAGAEAAASDQRAHTLHELEVWSLVGLAGLAVASAGLGWLLAGRVLRPVREITGAARRASERHLGERINLSGPEDELKELADTFDDMLDRLDLAFAAQRQFVANASHELRTPLTSMRTAIDVILAKPNRTTEQLEATAEKVRRSIDRAEHIIDALLTLAVSNQGLGDGEVEVVDLATAAEDALDSVRDAAASSGLRVDSDLDRAEVTGNRVLLERLVANLVENAVVHNTRGGWVRVRTRRVDARAVIEVSNSGPAVSSDLLPRLFEPFQRGAGRTGSSGVGLGLSIVQAVAGAHDAQLEAVPGAEGGLSVTVTMPTRATPAPRHDEPAPPEDPAPTPTQLETVPGNGSGATGPGDEGPAA